MPFECGDRVLLPRAILEDILAEHSSEFVFPVFFEIESADALTVVSVSEFTSEAGICVLPHWLIQELRLPSLGAVEVATCSAYCHALSIVFEVRCVTIPYATKVTLQPLDESFYDLPDPKASLKTAFQRYGAVSAGRRFPLQVCEDTMLWFVVLRTHANVYHEVRGGSACIVDVDLEVRHLPMRYY